MLDELNDGNGGWSKFMVSKIAIAISHPNIAFIMVLQSNTDHSNSEVGVREINL